MSSLGASKNSTFLSLTSFKGCSDREILSIAATADDPLAREGATNLIAQGASQQTIQGFVSGKEGAEVQSTAAQILQGSYVVCVA
jgi:hypothetical protein